MAKKQQVSRTDSPLLLIGKYTWLVLITLIISCYLVYAFVSSIGIPFLSDPRPAIPFPMAFMLCLVLWVVVGIAGVKWLKLKWYKVLITIVVTILVFAVVLIGPSEYREYQRRQLPKRAAEHAGAIVLHDAMIDAKDEADGDIYLAFLVPFEVTKEISSHELPFLFESVAISEKYPFSSKEVCNEELYDTLSKGYTLATGGKLFLNFDFLQLFNFVDAEAIDKISNIKPDKEISTKFESKAELLTPNERYYIYNFLHVKSPSCTAKDFINEKVTEPFIKVKK